MDLQDLYVMEEVGDIEDLLNLPVPKIEGKKKRATKSTKTVTIVEGEVKPTRRYTRRTPEPVEVENRPVESLNLDIVYESLQETEGCTFEGKEEEVQPQGQVTSQWNTKLLLENMRAYYNNPVVYIFHMGRGEGMKCADGVVDFIHKLETYLIDRHVESMTVFATEKYENPGINNAYVTQDYHIKWDGHYGNRSGVGILLYEAPRESVEEFYKDLCDFKMSKDEMIIHPRYFLQKLYKSGGTPVKDHIFSLLQPAKKN